MYGILRKLIPWVSFPGIELKMKKILLFLVILFFIPGILFSDEKVNLTNKEKAFIRNFGEVRVHNENNWPPFNFSEKGVPKGFSVDYMKLIASKTGLKLKFVNTGSWDKALNRIKKGELDVILNIAKLKEREAYLRFTDPYMHSQTGIYALESRTDIKKLSDLSGKKIAIPREFILAKQIRNKYPEIEVVDSADVTDSIRLVAEGKVDATISIIGVINHLLEKNFISNLKLIKWIDDKDFFFPIRFGVKKELKTLYSIINKGMKSVKDEEIIDLRRKWFESGVKTSFIELTNQELAFLMGLKEINVCYLGFLNPLMKNWKKEGGFLEDYMNLLFENLNINFVNVLELGTCKNMGKKVDIVLEQGEKDLFLNNDKFLYTQPVFKSPWGIITKKEDSNLLNLENLNDKKLAIAKNNNEIKRLRKFYPEIKLRFYKTPYEALESVATGESDAAFGSCHYFSFLLRDNSLDNFSIFPILEDKNIPVPEIRIGIRNDWGVLKSIIDKSVPKIKNTFFKTMDLQWAMVDHSSKNKKDISFTEKEKNFIRENKRLVYTDADWSPLSIINKSGKHEGMIADYFRLISSKTGFEFVYKKSYSLSEVLKSFKDGEVDLIPKIDIKDGSPDDLNFSKSFLSFPLVIVTREKETFIESTSKLNGKKIAALENSASSAFVKDNYPEINLVPSAGIEEGLLKVINGEVFAYVGHMAFVIESMRKLGLQSLKISGATEFIFEHKIGVSGKDPELLSIVNKAIDSISEKEKREIYNKWIDVNYSGIYDPWVLWRVITIALIVVAVIILWNRKLAKFNSSLKESEKKFKDLSDLLPQMIYETDKNGILTYTNKFGFQLCEIQEEQIGKIKFSDLFATKDKGVIEENIRLLNLRESSGPSEHLLTRYDGSIIPVINYYAAVYSGVKLVGIRGIIIDISQRKEIEEAVKVADRAKTNFIARMSHEIRTPMNAIIGLSHLALRSDLDPVQTDYVKKIHDSAESLLKIINDVLDFSKMESNRLDLELIDFSISSILKKLEDIIGLKAEEKGLDIVLDIDEEIPEILIGDPLRLSQVLINLANNAVKFTDQGRILISASLNNLSNDNASIIFKVSDTGIGLSKEEQDKLFRAFTQADESTTRKYGGTGLGLAICKYIIEAMDGEIGVESIKGRGSCFYFSIDFAITKKSSKEFYLKKGGLEGLKALGMNLSPDFGKEMKKNLNSMGIDFENAETEEKALGLVEASNEISRKYDFIFLDYEASGEGAIESAKKIGMMQPFGTSSVILMVPPDRVGHILQKSVESGVSWFLSKPVIESDLYDLLNGIHLDSKKGIIRYSPELKKLKLSVIRGADILLVEDERVNQQVAKEFLVQAGFNVDIAENGETAVSAVAEKDYDIVLMDIQMPELDGIEATKRIRSNVKFENLPILAMTAHALQGDRGKSLDSGMNDHITKPIDPDELLFYLIKWIKPGHRRIDNPEQYRNEDSEINEIPEFKNIDLSKGLSKFQGNYSFYKKILVFFHEDYSKKMDDANRFFENRDFKNLKRVIHSLKGVSGNLGAVKLFNKATEIDYELKYHNHEKVLELYPEFIFYFENLLDEIETKLIFNLDSDADDEKITDFKNAEKLFLKLIPYLKNGDFKVVSLVSDIKETFQLDDNIKKLINEIESFDFEDALKTIEIIKQDLTNS